MKMAYVLLNIGHQERRPRCDRAAFRILGVFESVDEATHHAGQLPTDSSIHLLPLRKWTPLMRHEDCSADEQNAHLIKLGERHRQRAAAHAEEFAENVAKRQTGKTSNEGDAAAPRITNGGKLSSVTASSPVLAIPRNSEVRLQQFAVVSIIADNDEPDTMKQEPAIIIWGVTETEAAAKDMIKTELADEAADVHLDVVAMYEWLHPTAVDPEQITEEYRDKRLDELMQHRKTESRRVASFRKKCAAEGYEAPLISLENPSLTTAGVALSFANEEDPVIDASSAATSSAMLN